MVGSFRGFYLGRAETNTSMTKNILQAEPPLPGQH
jgi:hypothetical protein